MPARRRKLGASAEERFANLLLENVAKATGSGWFSFKQRSRLIRIIREEFHKQEDAGKLHTDDYLELIEADTTAQYFPKGNRPEPPDEDEPEEGPSEDGPIHVQVEDVEITETEDCGCGGTTSGPIHIECELPK